MKIFIALLSCSALVAGCSSTSTYSSEAKSADVGKFGLGASAGTTGATLDAKYAISNKIGVRGNFNYLTFDIDEEFDDIDYEGELELTTFGGFVDFAPFGNGFVLSGGAYLGNKELDIDASPTTAVTIGDQSFDPSEIGTLAGTVELNNFAPYAGIGYDNFIAGSKEWSFNARAGVMFTGSPDVELVSANGSLSDNQILLDELEAEIQSIEDDAEDFKYYPVVTVGVTRRF